MGKVAVTSRQHRLTCRGQSDSEYYRDVLEEEWAKEWSFFSVCVCCEHTVSLHVCMHTCGLAYPCRVPVCGVCLPAGYSAAYWELLAVLL